MTEHTDTRQLVTTEDAMREMRALARDMRAVMGSPPDDPRRDALQARKRALQDFLDGQG